MIKTPLSTVIGGAFWTPGATVINGAKLSFEIVMKKLFANGEQGFYQDPYDLGVMFQDAAGTVPVTAVGQAVGLILDKSKNLSILNISELSYKRGFQFGPGATLESLTPSPDAVTTDWIPVDSLSFYKVIATASNRSMIQFKSSSGVITYETSQSNTSASINNMVIRTGIDTKFMRIYFNSINANESLTVAKIKGNHAYQTTSAARPILRDAPRRIDYDGVDDKLRTSFPAPLTNATIVRAVPGVGAQILTGQSIPATYEDSTDHCGLIVINRALTPSETSAIATEFNKRAVV